MLSAANSPLPSATELDPDTFRQAKALLQKSAKLKAEISEREEKLSELKAELAIIAKVCSPKGFRWGMIGFEYHGYVSRKTLNKKKLATHVAAEIIDSCYEDGKEFESMKLIVFDME